MDKTAKEAWNELKGQFNRDQEALYKVHSSRLTAIDDAYREGNDERDERRYKFMMELKRETNAANARYVKEHREAMDAYKFACERLENDRQQAYAKFRSEHPEFND